MTRIAMLLSTICLLAMPGPAMAQDADFFLTYHVERTPASRLGIEACGDAANRAARQAGLSSGAQTAAGQLVTVTGGAENEGAFVIQCIAVGDVTVSVVHGVDYQRRKGAIGAFADQAFDAIKASIRS